jgi:hypothetical protein
MSQSLRSEKANHRGTGMIVEIDFEVFLDRLSTIGMNVRRIRQITDLGGMFPRLRAQIVGNPVSGEAYLLLDAPENPPPVMDLGFKPNQTYVPFLPSTVTTMQQRLPALLDRADATLRTLSQIVDRIPDSLNLSDRFFNNVERGYSAPRKLADIVEGTGNRCKGSYLLSMNTRAPRDCSTATAIGRLANRWHS